MPDQDDKSGSAQAALVSSGQTRPVETGSPPYDDYAKSDSQVAGPSESTHQRSSTDQQEDAAESSSKNGRSKPSETLRRSQACLACRKRKLRCDAKKPTCTRCEKAWLAYHPSGEGASQATPPPCEYDTSLLAKIFKRGGSSDPPNSLPSQPSSSSLRYPDNAPDGHHERLLEANEHLRAQIAYLEGQLRRGDDGGHSHQSRWSSEASSASGGPPLSSRVSVQHLTDDRHGDAQANKRMKPSNDYDPNSSRPQGGMPSPALKAQTGMTRRDDVPASSSKPYGIGNTEHTSQTQPSPVTPSVFNWSPNTSKPALSYSAPPHYANESSATPLEPVTSQPSLPILPSRQALDRLIDICQREAWLFSGINGYALSDVAALLETTSQPDSDQLTARALMMVTVATGLPLLAASYQNGISSSPAFINLDDLLRTSSQSEIPRLDDPQWLATVTKMYADGARNLLERIQTYSGGHMSTAAFIVRLLLVEISHTKLGVRLAQANLASAASEARLLHLHSTSSGNHPRLPAGQNRSSHLARALRGLMPAKDESFAFWSLFLHDCFQSRLAMLPVTLERQSIRTPFPRRADSDNGSALQQDLEEVEAYMQQRRGLPILEAPDNSMSLLIKVSLALDQCCEYASTIRHDPSASSNGMARRPSLQADREKTFVAAHECIRNSRMMLSHFDDRTLSQSERYGSGANSARARENVVSTLVLQDQLRFAAEVTHHLAVLSLFETAMNVSDPWIQGGEARGMMVNASVWLSRLSGMALQNTSLLLAIPSFCSTAFFIAARWLLFLQGADPNHFHADISTLVLALSKRAKCYGRDYSLARAIVALKRERDFYGRICISPFTWPIEAVSEFIPVAPLVRPGSSQGMQAPSHPAKAGFVSVATLATSIDDSAVLDLANSPVAS